MAEDTLARRMEEHLHALTEHPDRHVGGVGNRAATELFAARMTELGYAVRRTVFECFEWEYGEARLMVAEETVPLNPGPYSLPCDALGSLVAVDSVEALEALEGHGQILLLHGAIAKGQIMPKNFTFYNPESHKRVIRALEATMPACVIAATGKDPEMVGSQYPFPLFEDGDLDIPNAYMKDTDGVALLAHAGSAVRVVVDSGRVPATGEHIVATSPGTGEGRIVLFGHIDSRVGSPGALDNGSGVAVLLGVAELLAGSDPASAHGPASGQAHGPSLEFVPLNGEDDYANPGEMLWVGENADRFGDIVLGINIDDAGLRGFGTHVSFYGCPEPLQIAVRQALDGSDGRITEGPQWFQSDHAILGIYEVPAIAVTSAGMLEFMSRYAHTERDTIELADYEAIAGVARFLAEVIARIRG